MISQIYIYVYYKYIIIYRIYCGFKQYQQSAVSLRSLLLSVPCLMNQWVPHAVQCLPQSAPWLVSVCAAFWQSGRCPPPLRNASSPGQYSEWWRHLSVPRQHYSNKWLTIVYIVPELSQQHATSWSTSFTYYAMNVLSNISIAAYLQWTLIGPSWPNCSLVLCTWPIKSMKPSPDLGTPCSGQSVNWNWRTVRDWPS